MKGLCCSWVNNHKDGFKSKIDDYTKSFWNAAENFEIMLTPSTEEIS